MYALGQSMAESTIKVDASLNMKIKDLKYPSIE